MRLTSLLSIFLLTLLAAPALSETDPVVELTDKTINEFLQNNEFVLLEFYTEGCPHCQEFAPTYTDVAKQVAATGLNVKVAKIDGNNNEESSTEWGIQGFPTVKFVNLKNNIKADYNGERTVEAIMKFLDNKINRKVLPIADAAHLAALEKEKKVFIVFCGSNTTEAFSQFDKVLAQHEDLEFYWSDSAEVHSTLKCAADQLIIVKSFDEGRLLYDQAGAFNSTHFQDWVSVYSTPVVLEMTNENVQMSMQNQIPTIFLIKGKSADTKALDDLFHRHANQHRREIVFISSKTGDELTDKILEFYQVKEDQLPAILGLSPQGEQQLSKYKHTGGNIDEEFLNQWIKDFVAQKLTKFYQSENIPADPLHEGVNVVVGKNFHELVLNNNKDVLVELYAPWCGHCKQLAPKYARLVQKLKNNANLLIAKMDGTANEYEGVEIEGFPTLIFFKGGNSTPEEKLKNKKIFDGERTVAGMIEFLKNNTHHGINDIITLENEAQLEEQEKAEEEKMGMDEGDQGEDFGGDDAEAVTNEDPDQGEHHEDDHITPDDSTHMKAGSQKNIHDDL